MSIANAINAMVTAIPCPFLGRPHETLPFTPRAIARVATLRIGDIPVKCQHGNDFVSESAFVPRRPVLSAEI